VVEFLGGKHANFSMGLWRRDVLTHLSGHADTLRLINQPLTWCGTT
jgi:hypothetical protein